MRFNSIFKSVLLTFFAAMTGMKAAAAEWWLVADGIDTMPMDSVICLVASDDSDRMMVVGTDRVIGGVAKVWFEAFEDSAVPEVWQQHSHADVGILYTGEWLTMSGLHADADVRIYAANGRLVRACRLKATDGTATIGVGDLSSGMYIVQIAGTSFKMMKK